MNWTTVTKAGCVFVTLPLYDGFMQTGPFVRYDPYYGSVVVAMYSGQVPPTGLEEYRMPGWFTLA